MPGNKPPKTPNGQRRVCEQCKGRGMNGKTTCSGCGGKGYVIIGNI